MHADMYNMNSLEIQIMRRVLTYTTQSIFQYQRAMLLFLGPNMQVEQNMPFEIRFFLARSFYFIEFDPNTLWEIPWTHSGKKAITVCQFLRFFR